MKNKIKKESISLFDLKWNTYKKETQHKFTTS